MLFIVMPVPAFCPAVVSEHHQDNVGFCLEMFKSTNEGSNYQISIPIGVVYL